MPLTDRAGDPGAESGASREPPAPAGELGRLLEAERALRVRREEAAARRAKLLEEARARAEAIRRRAERELEAGLDELRRRVEEETRRECDRVRAGGRAEAARWSDLPEERVEALARLVRERLVLGEETA